MVINGLLKTIVKAHNVICGMTCFLSIEMIRNYIAYLDFLGSKRIPDTATSGDFKKIKRRW